MHHSSLLVVYLESLNCSPRALIGAFSVTTEAAMKDQQALELSQSSIAHWGINPSTYLLSSTRTCS